MADCHLKDVRCREDDARLVLQWRNDPVTREGSFHTGERHWADFWPDFRDGYPPAGAARPQFVMCAGRPVAFLRFDPPRTGHGDDDLVEISINVAPDHRSRGIGVAALHLAEGYLHRFGHAGILALVKADNAISRRVFEKAGYQATGEISVTPSEGMPPTVAIRYIRPLKRESGTMA
ncbi:MAG: GNAT family N-acetyltransferase [Rhodospirillaceae bacterium]|nr:GNAT family N-acetyltransferase [Rhodospirillaceae bacterium]